MKLLKQLLTAGALCLALATAADAQTVVRLTGSTAFRGATHTALTKIITGLNYGYTGGTLSGASQAIFTGSVGGNPVIVKTSWSGSVGGIQTVSQGLNVNFLADDTAGLSPGGTANLAAGAVGEVPDIAMADNFQGATPFKTPVLVDQRVGIVPFKWVVSKGAPLNITNVTPQLAQFLWGSGQMALSLWTGSAADSTVKIFATGRDPDSGTRLTAFAESGVGVDSIVVQYQPVINGANIDSHILWPQTVVNGITFTEGNGGFSSGGTLVNAMTKDTTALGGFYVSYMSNGDAATAIAGGARELAYNGVTASTTAIQQGLYTFWGYQHLLYKTTLTGIKKSTADTLANQILTVDSPILLSTMKVKRNSDGGLIRQDF